MAGFPGLADATREAVILVALGSPVAASREAIAEFLLEFLSDPRVVDMPQPLWQPILRGPILKRRPGEVLEQYESIWTKDGSPLRVHTAAQGRALAKLLPGRQVRIAYQYGTPNLLDAFDELARTHDLVTILPTYPQFAPATVGSVADRIARAVRSAASDGFLPRVRAARSWPRLASYVDWHAERIVEALEEAPVDLVIFSWHGVPDRPAHRPGAYRADCHATALAIVDAVRRRGRDIAWRETFQSKFGPGRWLAPATIETMARLPSRGVKDVLVLNPGFLADCLETIYEMDVLNADAFAAAGGRTFRRIAPPTGEQAARMYADLHSKLS